VAARGTRATVIHNHTYIIYVFYVSVCMFATTIKHTYLVDSYDVKSNVLWVLRFLPERIVRLVTSMYAYYLFIYITIQHIVLMAIIMVIGRTRQ